MNLHYLRHFVKHYLVSTPVDILHSPFVFGMQQQCIKHPFVFEQAEAERKKLLQSHELIRYQDFGASGNSRTLPTKTLAAQHLKPRKLAGILARLAEYIKAKHVLELGTSLGITTCYLARQTQQKVYTIEACADVRNTALSTFKNCGLENKIDSRLGIFDDILPGLLKEVQQFDIVFIDGNHTEEATLRYFEQVLPNLHNDSLLIFDDIYWSKGMTQAWEKIKQDPRITVTIDLFFIGIVSLRREQAPQHFRLRVF